MFPLTGVYELVEVSKSKDGIDWVVRDGYAWRQDKVHCDEEGCMALADPKCVAKRAKKWVLKQLGSLGAGNHYAEVQVVEELYARPTRHNHHGPHKLTVRFVS